MLAHRREEQFQRPLCGMRIAVFASERRKPSEAPRRSPVARGRRVIVTGLGPMQQAFMVARGEKESAASWILELFQQHLGKLFGEFQFGGRKPRLEQLEQRR